uniref:Tyrosyl-DNA phosphodiesterase 1 n=1 Tax=Labrus bergylta TaxID=56723 RepID=A0A3Q3L0R4_9LABR
MSQDSQHGRWTVSSSDEDDEGLPPSGTSTSKPRPPVDPSNRSHRSPSPPSLKVKPEPDYAPVSSLVIGSEARQSAAVNNPSLAGKRKKEESEGSGWALSDSDDEDVDLRRKSVGNPPKRAPPSPKTKKTKVENERPPSPHGRVYYIDEPDDFFETSLPSASDPYRFYLNKVTGLDRRFNTGALHIRGEESSLSSSQRRKVMKHLKTYSVFNVLRERPVLIVHGDKREAKARLVQQAQPFPHVRFCQAKLDIAFGTHHTKMMLLWYEEGFRVVIMTSNLIRADWYQKTQG